MTRDNLRLRDPPMSCSVWCTHTATGETIELPPESAIEGGDLHVQQLRARVARLEHLVAELIEARRREENDGR